MARLPVDRRSMMPELSILITRRGSSKNHGRGFGGGEGRLKLKSRIIYGSSLSFEYQRRRGHRIELDVRGDDVVAQRDERCFSLCSARDPLIMASLVRVAVVCHGVCRCEESSLISAPISFFSSRSLLRLRAFDKLRPEFDHQGQPHWAQHPVSQDSGTIKSMVTPWITL